MAVISRVIIEVYKIFLLTILRPGDIFIHNGILTYTVYIVRAILREIGIEIVI
jgi:hypothetical protein